MTISSGLGSDYGRPGCHDSTGVNRGSVDWAGKREGLAVLGGQGQHGPRHHRADLAAYLGFLQYFPRVGSKKEGETLRAPLLTGGNIHWIVVTTQQPPLRSESW